MTVKDYYEVLGLTAEAPAEEIRIAYRKLAKANHPDKHQGDPAYVEKFKDIQEAYDVLSDAEKRKEYDAQLARQKSYNKKDAKKSAANKKSDKSSDNSAQQRRKQNSPNNPNNLAPRKLKIYIPWLICISKNAISPCKLARNTIVFSLPLAKNISIG